MRQVKEFLQATPVAFYIDVCPLFEENWTGIPVVAANIAKKFLEYCPERTNFFFENSRVQGAAVEDALRRSSGTYLARDFFSGEANGGPLRLFSIGLPTVGVFPSVKRVRGLFDVECSIVHDISTIVTPQYHDLQNVKFHSETVVSDLMSNDVTFCVSRSTMDDITSYLGWPQSELYLMYNGVDWPRDFQMRCENEIERSAVEPYVLVLGTREPRKNITHVFRTLTEYPDLLAMYRFVIAGRPGWLQEQTAVPGVLSDAVQSGRILLPGFVSDYVKYKLLTGAQFLLFPSILEGFGLPVLESLSVGTPVIASFSSSIPEIGGDACLYFDPLSASGLYTAIKRFAEMSREDLESMRIRCRTAAEPFSWDNAFAVLLNGLAPHITAVRDSTPGNSTRRLAYQN